MLDILWIAIPALTSLLYAILLYNLTAGGTYLEPAERWRAAFLLAATLWALSSMALHALHHVVSPTWLIRVWTLINFALPLTTNGFVAHFLALPRARRLTTVGIVLYVPMAYLVLAGYVVREAWGSGGRISFSVGPALPFYGALWAFYMYSSGFYLLRERMRSPSPEFRQRLNYLLGVIILLTLGNALNATPLSSYPLDILLAALAAVLMGLSITRNHLLAVRIAAGRTMVFVLLGLLYVAGVASLLYTLTVLGQWALALTSVIVAIVTGLLVLSYTPVRRRVERAVARFFLAERDIEPLLLRLSRIGTRLRPPADLARAILREVRSFLGLSSAGLFLHFGDDDMYRLIAAEGVEVEEDLIHFQADSPLIAILKARSEALTLNMLAELPLAAGLWIQEWEMLHTLQAEVLVPIHAEEELIGFFVLGRQQENQAYSRRELRQTFPLLASQISIALDNSRLYAQVEAKAEELARANEELQELDRLKTEIIQNVSHELRTPLTLIMGYAELLEQGLIADPEEVRDAGRLMLEHARHLRHLVEQLLAFQRLERAGITPHPFDLYAWLQDVVKAWQPALAKAGLTLITDVDASVGEVMGDKSYLRQVVDNLLDNARKFSPQGGHIFLRAWRGNGDIYISVADEGVGVPPDKLPRLFERFYQVQGGPRRKYGGMGIGLALCKEIVEQHGGRIWAESEGLGKGLTVTFTLPVHRSPYSPDGTTTEAQPAHQS